MPEPASLDACHVKVGFGDVVAPSPGPARSKAAGAVVSTRQVQVTSLVSVRVPSSVVAFTTKWCTPSSTLPGVQPTTPSSEHEKVAPLSHDASVNCGWVSDVFASGPETIAVAGILRTRPMLPASDCVKTSPWLLTAMWPVVWSCAWSAALPSGLDPAVP